MRVSSSAAVRSNAGRLARSFGPSSAGSGMLQCTRSGCDGKLGTDLADAVAQRDHEVEALGHELVQVLGSVRADVDAALLHHPYRIGDGAASGCFPPTRLRSFPPTSASSNASAICDRALFPVQRNKTRCRRRRRPRPARRRRCRHEPQRRDAARHRPPAAAPHSAPGRPRSSCPVHRPSCDARTRARRSQLTQVVRHQALPLAEQLGQLPHRPVAVRRAPAAAANEPDARPAAGTAASRRPQDSTSRCGARHHHPIGSPLNQAGLMDLWRGLLARLGRL